MNATALFETARDFYNMTVADTDVRITTADKDKRDAITLASETLRAALEAALPVAVGAVVLAWIHEDQLSDGYPYDAMFPHSKVDGVRMFPVFAPATPAGKGGES